MEKYSFLLGTDIRGSYTQLGASAKLADFLNSVGASNASTAADKVQSLLSGFSTLPGYETEKVNAKPVAVRYAPMHLYKLEESMAGMKAFCALSVNGLEHRSGRVTQYNYTTVMSRDAMHHSKDGYNYLDLLFGNKLLSWQEVKAHREKREKVNFDRLPDKVTPEIARSDLSLITTVIEAIYADKKVVIRLEQDVSFNSRCFSLLTGIYSLIQPRLASEVGFAAYEDPNKIADLVRQNSIRIIVLPAGAPLDSIAQDFVILDLAEGEAVEKLPTTPLSKMLVDWEKLPWNYRQQALEGLFSQEDDFQNAEIFVQQSTAFFDALRAHEKWRLDKSRNNTLQNMEQIQAEHDEHVSPLIPWAEDVFKQKVKRMVRQDQSIEGMNAELAAELYTRTAQNQKRSISLYRFGRTLGDVNTDKLYTRVRDHQKAVDDEKHQQEMIAKDERYASELQQEKAKTAAAVADGQEKLRLQQENYEATFRDEVEKHQKELDAERKSKERQAAEHSEVMQKQQEAYEATIRNAEAQAKSERDEKEKAFAERDESNRSLDGMKAQYTQTLMDKKAVEDACAATVAKAKNAVAAAVAETAKVQENLSKVSRERDELHSKLEETEGKYQKTLVAMKAAEDTCVATVAEKTKAQENLSAVSKELEERRSQQNAIEAERSQAVEEKESALRRCADAVKAAKRSAEKESDAVSKMQRACASEKSARQEAEQEKENARIAQEKLDSFLRRGIHGKSLGLGIGIGVLVALLLCAVVIMRCLALRGNDQQPTIPQETVTVEQTTPIVEATVPVTTESEAVETTETVDPELETAAEETTVSTFTEKETEPVETEGLA